VSGRPLGAGGVTAVRRAAAAWVLSSTADNFLLFALFWVAGPQGWSGAQTALVVLVLRLPVLAGGLVGGRAVDRVGARGPMLADLGGRAVLMAALAGAGWSGTLPLAAVLVAGALAGLLTPVSYAAARWLVPRVVSPAAVPRANALLALGDQLPLLAGALLVGPVLALLGPGRGMLVPAAMLALAAALAWRLPAGGAADGRAVRPGADVAAERRRDDARRPGSPSPWRSPRITALVGLSVAYYLAYGPFETVPPALIREQLGGGPGLYGLLWALFGVGALATLPLAPRLARGRPGVVNAVGALAWGLVMLPVAVTGEPWAAALVFLVGGAVWGPYTTVETTALHRWADPAHHGRLFGTQRALLLAAIPLGAAAGALAAAHLAPATVIALSCAACSAAGLLALCVGDLRRSTAAQAPSAPCSASSAHARSTAAAAPAAASTSSRSRPASACARRAATTSAPASRDTTIATTPASARSAAPAAPSADTR
jgi:Major Facilitator Superfamily